METRSLIRARAVRWCGSLAGWFPWLRPDEAPVLERALEIAVRLGPNDGDTPRSDVRETTALLGEAARERLVERFVDEQGDQWAAVCADAGDTPALERAVVAGAVHAAIVERRLPPPRRFRDLESGRAPARWPLEVLLVTLFPETVWSVVDLTEFREGGDPIEERGVAAQARRVRALTALLRPQLPVPRYPRASRMLEEAYALVADEPDFADIVAADLLTIYVAATESPYVTSLN